MAINTYETLRDSIARWIHRADAVSQIPDFISLAEARITADLTTARPLWQRSRATLASGARTVGTPNDMMSFVGCALVTGDGLEELTVVALPLVQWTSNATGRPSACAVSGETLHVYPAADQTYTLELVYHRRLPALSSSVASNWVLEQAPHLYLYGALIESVGFTGESAKLQQWSAMYENALSRLQKVSWDGPTRLVSDVPVMSSSFDISRGY